MGAALKKNQDYTLLARIKWAAWGVIDIEAMERMQRRNYINHVREELKLHGWTLEAGGSQSVPYYRIFKMGTPVAGEKQAIVKSFTSSTLKKGAFQKVCRDVLGVIDPQSLEHHEG